MPDGTEENKGVSTEASGAGPQPARETGRAARGAKGPDFSQAPPSTLPAPAGNLLAIPLQGNGGVWDAFWQRSWERQQGLGAMGRSGHAPPPLHLGPPTPWPRARRPARARRQLLSCCWPSAGSHSRTIFGPGGSGRESKERSWCSRQNLVLEEIPAPAGPRGSRCGSRAPVLKGAGGLRLREPGRVHMGTPGLLLTLLLTNCSNTQRDRGTASRSHPPSLGSCNNKIPTMARPAGLRG